jgi:hypothetical protein
MKYLWEIRKASKEITIEIDRTKVKILMSKFEIQQNNKIEQELEKIKHFWIKDTILRVK